MATLKLRPQAEEDLEQIHEYISSNDPEAADRLLGKLMEACELIAHEPYMSRVRENLGKDIRLLPVGTYVIIYQATDEQVDVIRILYGAQDIPLAL